MKHRSIAVEYEIMLQELLSAAGEPPQLVSPPSLPPFCSLMQSHIHAPCPCMHLGNSEPYILHLILSFRTPTATPIGAGWSPSASWFVSCFGTGPSGPSTRSSAASWPTFSARSLSAAASRRSSLRASPHPRTRRTVEVGCSRSIHCSSRNGIHMPHDRSPGSKQLY